MRAPQYGRYKVTGRPLGRAEALPPAVGGAVTIASPNKPVSLRLWHKSAYGFTADKPGPLMTRAVKDEPSKVLCEVPGRDRYKSRNDRYRIYSMP